MTGQTDRAAAVPGSQTGACGANPRATVEAGRGHQGSRRRSTWPHGRRIRHAEARQDHVRSLGCPRRRPAGRIGSPTEWGRGRLRSSSRNRRKSRFEDLLAASSCVAVQAEKAPREAAHRSRSDQPILSWMFVYYEWGLLLCCHRPSARIPNPCRPTFGGVYWANWHMFDGLV